MSSRASDPALDFALQCVSAVQSAYDARNDVPKRFRARCRHLIESLYYSGLAYTLAYVASRAGSSALNFALEAPVPNEIIKQVKQVREAEEAFYALYGAFLLAFLKQAGARGLRGEVRVFGELRMAEVARGLRAQPDAGKNVASLLKLEFVRKVREALSGNGVAPRRARS